MPSSRALQFVLDPRADLPSPRALLGWVAALLAPGLVLARVKLGHDLVGAIFWPVAWFRTAPAEVGPALAYFFITFSAASMASVLWLLGRLSRTKPQWLRALQCTLGAFAVPSAGLFSLALIALALDVRLPDVLGLIINLALITLFAGLGTRHIAVLLGTSRGRAFGAYVLAMLLGALPVSPSWRVQAFSAEGPSMDPVLRSGDRFAIDHWLLPQRGDVVVLASPRDNLDTVKRVIGMDGDTIELRDGVVLLNGQPLSSSSSEPCSTDAPFQPCVQTTERNGDRSYVTVRSVDSIQSTRPPLRVPPGHVYVLGDHRDRSNDSRAYGPVPMPLVHGVAYLRYAPAARIGNL